MSFDLKIFDGDLVVGEDGDLKKVQDTDKLIQDVLKFLLTEVRSNPWFQWYGSPISGTLIGSALDASFLVSMAENQIRAGLETIQNLQREQAAQQKLTPGEWLAALREVSILRNEINPTFFTIKLAVLTKAMRSATISFTVDS